MSDFVKREDSEFVGQLLTFAEKLPNYQAALGLAAQFITDAEDDAHLMGFTVTSISVAKTYSKGWVELKDNARKGKGTTPIATFPDPVDISTPPTAVPPGIEGRFRERVRQIKANSAYTTEMGEDMGIVAPEDTSELNQPVLTIKLDISSPVLGFKKGKNDGVNIYSKRTGEDAFSLLTFRSKSPYKDTRPNLIPGTPETRQYYANFVKDDVEHGTSSMVASISVG